MIQEGLQREGTLLLEHGLSHEGQMSHTNRLEVWKLKEPKRGKFFRNDDAKIGVKAEEREL